MQKVIKTTNQEKNVETHSDNTHLVKTFLFGVGITNDSKRNILEFIINSVKKNGKPYYIVTPNPEMVVLAKKNAAFQKVLNNAKIASNDGIGLSIAGQILGKPLKERFTGVELVEKLCERANDWPITVGFLGAGPKIAEMAAECLRSKYPGLKVAFAGSEWPEESSSLQENAKSKEQRAKHAKKDAKFYATSSMQEHIDILFVAFGAPKQELWMAEHVGKIPVKVMVGVGGAFDQIVTPSLRPPSFIQKIGMGWLYRLIRQPWRIKRQLALLEFILLVLRKKIGK